MFFKRFQNPGEIFPLPFQMFPRLFAGLLRLFSWRKPCRNRCQNKFLGKPLAQKQAKRGNCRKKRTLKCWAWAKQIHFPPWSSSLAPLPTCIIPRALVIQIWGQYISDIVHRCCNSWMTEYSHGHLTLYMQPYKYPNVFADFGFGVENVV